MFKITNETFGEIEINGKKMGYKSFIIVKDISSQITELAENKVVKTKVVAETKDTQKVQAKSDKKEKLGGN
jgi:hypothetical protein